MKRTLFVLVLSLLASMLFALGSSLESGLVTLDTVAPVLDLSSPNGGENWYIGDTHAILWTATDFALPATPVDLAYSINGGTGYTSIATSISNDGSYPWLLPAQQSYNARVRVTVTDAYGNTASKSSLAVFGITYVPPAAPTGISVNTSNNIDAVLTWDAVTQTIYSTPITPDGYIVLYNETPYAQDQYYYFLGETADLSYTHHRVVRFRPQMYYRVVAYKDYRGEMANLLQTLQQPDAPRTTLADIQAILKSRSTALRSTGNTDLHGTGIPDPHSTGNTDLQSVMWGDLQSPPQNPQWTSPPTAPNSNASNPFVVMPSGSFAPLDNDISTSTNRINAELQAEQNAELPAAKDKELPTGNSTRPRVHGSDTIGGAK